MKHRLISNIHRVTSFFFLWALATLFIYRYRKCKSVHEFSMSLNECLFEADALDVDCSDFPFLFGMEFFWPKTMMMESIKSVCIGQKLTMFGNVMSVLVCTRRVSICQQHLYFTLLRVVYGLWLYNFQYIYSQKSQTIKPQWSVCMCV